MTKDTPSKKREITPHLNTGTGLPEVRPLNLTKKKKEKIKQLIRENRKINERHCKNVSS